jgi:hypothetical protein
MRTLILALGAVAASLALPGSAAVAAGNFTLVNETGMPMSAVSIRRFGATEWQPLPVAPPAGARAFVAFADPECAFDLRAQLGGLTAIWSGVNLCEVKTVFLRREPSGELWVDYD